jgi:ligand-binding sensor domain-containing protein
MSDPFNLIWTGRTLELVEMDALKAGSWVGSTQSDIIRYLSRDRTLRQSRSGQPYPGLCAVMMVKDESDVIGHNIRHLHQLGFCRLVILDNGSRD